VRAEFLQQRLPALVLFLLLQVGGNFLGDLLQGLLDTIFIGLIERLHPLGRHGWELGHNLILDQLLH